MCIRDSAEVGLQLKLFNRNQGGVEAAQSDLERARKEVKRIELVLRERAASFVDGYSTAQMMADRYRTRILPSAQRSYELIYKRYGLMQASYPQVLGSEHSLYKLESAYVSALGQLWSNVTALKGFLLTDGLEAPTAPSDVCLLYTSDAADERSSVDLGGRRIIKKKNNKLS